MPDHPIHSDHQRRRPARAVRQMGGLHQRPWKQPRRLYAPTEILSADQVAAIHGTALTILAEIGMKVLAPEARALFRSAGAEVDEAELREIGRAHV